MRKHKPTPIKPMGVSINRPLWREMAVWCFAALGVAASAVVCAVLLIEWLAGCGETYVDAQGQRHAYECVFVPQPQKE